MKQISQHIYQVSLGPVNLFLIDEGGSYTLVDTGFPGSTDKIFAAITKDGKDPNNIGRIILTHSHPDHSGSAAEIVSRLKVPVVMHDTDAQLVEQGIAGREKNLSPGFANRILYNLFIKNGKNETPATAIAQRLQDGDVLPIAGGIQAIYTPGHSLGHICLLVKNEGVLIAGDICANMFGLDVSTVYEDMNVGIKSILKAASFDFDLAVFGHGKPLTGGANKKLRAHFEPMAK